MDEAPETVVAPDLRIDVDNRGPFTLNEIATIETLSGVPLPRWFDGNTSEGALRRAILFVIASRDDDSLTFEDAGEFAIVVPTLVD